MPKPATLLTEFVLDKLPDEPIHRRITLTRALAALETNPSRRADLLSIAAMLEDIEHNHRQLTLHFKGGRRA